MKVVDYTQTHVKVLMTMQEYRALVELNLLPDEERPLMEEENGQ